MSERKYPEWMGKMRGFSAGAAHAAGSIGPVLTLDQLRESDGKRQIAAACGAQKQQGMRDAFALCELEQERFDPVLANDVVENHCFVRTGTEPPGVEPDTAHTKLSQTVLRYLTSNVPEQPDLFR